MLQILHTFFLCMSKHCYTEVSQVRASLVHLDTYVFEFDSRCKINCFSCYCSLVEFLTCLFISLSYIFKNNVGFVNWALQKTQNLNDFVNSRVSKMTVSTLTQQGLGEGHARVSRAGSHRRSVYKASSNNGVDWWPAARQAG